MGSYLNPGNKGFRESLNSEIYVDKTGLIEKTNAALNTRQKFLCVSRPRRFGKSMAADMLAMLQKYLVFDLMDHFTDVRFRDENNLIQVMKDIYAKTKCAFVILIDEWDCLSREYQQNQNAQKQSECLQVMQ